MARPSLLLDTSLEPAVTSGGKKLRWSQFSQVTRLCLQRVHLKQWSEHWALGSGVHRVVGTDAHLMTECGWPLGRLSAWHSVLTKQSLSSWSWVLSSVPPTLYGLDNCPSLTGLCSGSAAPRPVQLWFKVKVLHKANLIPGACTWPVPLWGNPKQSALIPASGEIVTCVGRVTTGWGHPPQSRVVPDLQFSCSGSQGRADQTSKPPQGTAHCTAPHGFLQLLLLGPPTPSSSRDSWAPLWTLGSKQSVLLPHQTDQQRGWGEVQGRETCAHGGEQESESGLTCLLLWWWPCWAKETWHFWVFTSEQWSFLSTILVSERLMHQHRLLRRKNVSRKQWAEGHVPGHQEIAYQVPHVREQERKAGSLWIKARACPRFRFHSPFPISLRNCWLQCLRCYSTQEKY